MCNLIRFKSQVIILAKNQRSWVSRVCSIWVWGVSVSSRSGIGCRVGNSGRCRCYQRRWVSCGKISRLGFGRWLRGGVAEGQDGGEDELERLMMYKELTLKKPTFQKLLYSVVGKSLTNLNMLAGGIRLVCWNSDEWCWLQLLPLYTNNFCVLNHERVFICHSADTIPRSSSSTISLHKWRVNCVAKERIDRLNCQWAALNGYGTVRRW